MKRILLLLCASVSFCAPPDARTPGKPRSFAPPPGKVLHIAGQSREEFADYLARVTEHGQEIPNPAGAAFYTSLSLTGISEPHANVPGDNHQDLEYLARVYEPLLLQVALWLGKDQLSDIADGDYDAAIDRLTEALHELNRPIYLRIGYEFDGPHNAYEPSNYQEAFRHIANRVRAGSDRIALVWHSYAVLPTYGNRDVMAWYPGDEFVDWIGISFFSSEGRPVQSNRDRLVEIARRKGKPLMIAEASAIRQTPAEKRKKARQYWDYWYGPFFEFIEKNPEVSAFSIINVDWNSQQQHRDLDWGNATIASDPYVLQRWREKLEEPRYLHSEPGLYEKLETWTRE